jgi:hypothetical protein
MSLLYGVNKTTLDAYVREERKKIWQAVEARMSQSDTHAFASTGDDWWDLKRWVIAHAAKETQP